MIEKINLSTFELTSNMVLVKMDPNYDFLQIETPSGQVELQLVYDDKDKQDATKHYSITGQIIALPEKLFYFDDRANHNRGNRTYFESAMRNTMAYETDLSLKLNDRVYFNYKNQMDADKEQRIVDTDDYGLCVLISYESIYAKVFDENIVPVNGWVFFERDKTPEKIVLESGLIGIQKENVYGSPFGTITALDLPVKQYLDGIYEPEDCLNIGDQIVIQKGYGFQMAYPLHNEEIKNIEVVRRKNIMAVLTAVKPAA